MTQLSLPYTLTPGQPENISQVQADFDAVKTIINGQIDNGNIAANAGIVGSKLNAARVATTVAGLGTAADGALGLLRLGTTPYKYLSVIYDATYGKWVSAEKWAEKYEPSNDVDLWQTGATSPEDTEVSLYIFSWKLIHDAGMRLQTNYSARVKSDTGGVEARVGLNIYHFDDADASLTSLTTGYDADNSTSTSLSYVVRPDWAQPSLTPTKAHGKIRFGLWSQGSGAIAFAHDVAIGYRFVSA